MRLSEATFCISRQARSLNPPVRLFQSLTKRTNPCTPFHLNVYPTFRAFYDIRNNLEIIVVAMHVANTIPATELYSCTCIYKMRFDRLSDN